MSARIAQPQSGQLPQAKGPEMNDRDRLNEVLNYEKYLSFGYNTGLNEMQNPDLHRDVEQILHDVHALQFQLFEEMFKHGWYKMTAADAQEIAKAYQQFNGYHAQFPN
jgi:spore coat protein CotF